MSGDDRARLEAIQVSHCATSSLYQYIYTEQNACQFHHSHGAMQVGDTLRAVMIGGRACITASHRTLTYWRAADDRHLPWPISQQPPWHRLED